MLKKLFIGSISLLISINFAFANAPKLHKGKVVELKNGGSYLYIKVKNDQKEFWASIMKTNLKVGDDITLKEQIWMKNFKSKILDRTFDSILFADVAGAKNDMKGIHGIHGQNISKKPKADPKFNDGLYISKENAMEVTIGDLFKDKAKYKNKNVQFEATIIQISNKVMGNTWIKLDDGKSSVIFRSPNEDEKLSIGDRVKVVGTVNTDIDFGYGYKYEVLGVNSTFTKL